MTCKTKVGNLSGRSPGLLSDLRFKKPSETQQNSSQIPVSAPHVLISRNPCTRCSTFHCLSVYAVSGSSLVAVYRCIESETLENAYSEPALWRTFEGSVVVRSAHSKPPLVLLGFLGFYLGCVESVVPGVSVAP